MTSENSKPRRRINWSPIQIAVPLILALLGWGVTVEVRLSKSDSIGDLSHKVDRLERVLGERISNLENALMPVLVEYRLSQLVKGRNDSLSKEVPALPHMTARPTITFDDAPPKAKKEAENWARSQLPNPAQQAR